MKLEINQKKLTRQIEGIDKWRKSKDLGLSPANGVGTFNWVTGMGKTYAACYVINKILEGNSAATVYIVVPGEPLEKKWNEDIKYFIPEGFRSHITISTIHRLVDNPYRVVCTLLVLDEIHEYLTEDRLRVINGELIEAKYKLGLTATWEDKQGRHKKIESLIPIVDIIDEEEARKEGYIANYIEFNIGVGLTPNELSQYEEYSEVISRHMNKFGRGGLIYAGKCLSGCKKHKGIAYCMALAKSNGWSNELNLNIDSERQIDDLWHPKKIMGYAVALMNAVRDRKTVLYNAENKLRVAAEAVLKYNNLKTICFSQSTKFADRLCWVINENCKSKGLSPNTCTVYHSQLATRVVYDEIKGKEVKKGKTVLKREAIEAIKTDKSKVISTASSLDKGFDVPDIMMVITTSGTSNPTQHKQRNGRGIRAKEDEEAIVLIVNAYVKKTQEEIWLRNRQAKTKSIIYWGDNVSDISYTPKSKNSFNV